MSTAAYTCTSVDCVKGATDFKQHIARALSHRLAWMTLMTDRGLADNDYVLVLEEGVDAAAVPALGRPDLLAAVQAAAEASQAAGLFFLSDCGESRHADHANSSWSAGGWTYTRGVTSCTRAYGLFKWRAAWLWDALRAQVVDDWPFLSGGGTAASLGAHFLHGLPRLLPEAADWPVLISPN